MLKFDYSDSQHPDFDKKVLSLFAQDENGNKVAEIKVCPELGSNLFYLSFNGIQYLFEKANYKNRLMLLGLPIMYPFPNRIRNAQFRFDDVDYQFSPNQGDNYLHGMVWGHPFQCEEPVIMENGISIRNTVECKPGNDLYKIFPIANNFELMYTLQIDRVCIDFKVTNLDPSKRFPFGFGIHPHFQLIGSRDQIELHVPAESWMEASQLLPSGKLIDLENQPFDIRQPKLLSELKLDDVYWGMKPDRPMTIAYRQIRKKISFRASECFTHSCVFCPPAYPFFCLENQTCSADAINLHAQGFEDAAHLLILAPNESFSGSIQIIVSDL